MIEGNKHRFKKKLGQNFLKDKSVINRILSYVDASCEDLVIEVGPGDGAMTKELVKLTNVIAYEIDNELKPLLEGNINSKNLHIIWKDFLKQDIRKDLENYKYKRLFLVANLPYYITTPIILKIIEENLNLDQVVIMVQKEVAERFSSFPGSKKYSSITVFLNYYFNIEKLFDVSKNCFYPKPSVDSSIVRLTRKNNKVLVKEEKKLFKLIRDSFQFKRKTLKNNLGKYDLEKIEKVLKKHDMDLSIRAENIPLEIFVEIVNNL